MKTHYYFLVVLSLFLQNSFAQDQIFLNPNQALVSLNPSFAGSNGGIRNQSTFSNYKYSNFSYSSFYNGFDAYVKKLDAGIALSYLGNFFSGNLSRQQQLSVSYAQHFSITNSALKITPSLQVNYINSYANMDYYNWGQPPLAFVSVRQSVGVSSGVLLNYKGFYAGASVFNINRPDVGNFGSSKLPLRYSFHASYNMVVSENLLLNIVTRLNFQQYYQMGQIGFSALAYKHLVMSLNYSTGEIAFANVGYRHKYFAVTAGFAFSVSRLAPNSKYLEFGLSYTLRNKEQRKTLTDFEKW